MGWRVQTSDHWLGYRFPDTHLSHNLSTFIFSNWLVKMTWQSAQLCYNNREQQGHFHKQFLLPRPSRSFFRLFFGILNRFPLGIADYRCKSFCCFCIWLGCRKLVVWFNVSLTRGLGGGIIILLHNSLAVDIIDYHWRLLGETTRWDTELADYWLFKTKGCVLAETNTSSH